MAGNLQRVADLYREAEAEGVAPAEEDGVRASRDDDDDGDTSSAEFELTGDVDHDALDAFPAEIGRTGFCNAYDIGDIR